MYLQNYLKRFSRKRSVLQVNPILFFLVLCVVWVNPSTAQPPQTHDVPMFHNDDGLGLLQDCTFMLAIGTGEITEIPMTVAARSTSCLSSIKSVAQVMYRLQQSGDTPVYCFPSVDPDWLEVLEFVVEYMEKQAVTILPDKPYGVWIMEALNEKYPCE